MQSKRFLGRRYGDYLEAIEWPCVADIGACYSLISVVREDALPEMEH